MLDEMDDGARIGVTAALGVVMLLLFGLIGGLAFKSLHAKAAVAAAKAQAPAAKAEVLIEGPLTGELAGTLFFASGAAALPADAASAVAAAKTAAEAAPTAKIVLSGFHDATGDPARNAQLAKERAQAVRDALKAAGLPADRIALRKPESTTGDGTSQEARRVEIRLVP